MDIIQLFSQDLFVSSVLLILVIIYGFYAIVIAIQIITYNRLIHQTTFAPIFQLIALIHIGLTLALLFAIVLTI